jgi:hypothetical protein
MDSSLLLRPHLLTAETAETDCSRTALSRNNRRYRNRNSRRNRDSCRNRNSRRQRGLSRHLISRRQRNLKRMVTTTILRMSLWTV